MPSVFKIATLCVRPSAFLCTHSVRYASLRERPLLEAALPPLWSQKWRSMAEQQLFGCEQV